MVRFTATSDDGTVLDEIEVREWPASYRAHEWLDAMARRVFGRHAEPVERREWSETQ